MSRHYHRRSVITSSQCATTSANKYQ